MFSLALTFICGVFFAESAVITVKDEGELFFLNVIFRHGARTTYAFYPNDPYKSETFYPYGLGSLTNEGKLGEYKLGQYLKSLYSDFLGEDYTEDKVYVRSTEITRTQTSAQLVLAGLFPPSKKLTWHPDLLWQPIPISYSPAISEDILHRKDNCPYKNNVLKDLPNIPDAYEKFLKKYEDLYKYIQEYSGKEMKSPTDAAELFFNLKCEIKYHKNSGDLKPTALTIPGCEVLCPLQQFKDLQKDLLPIISIEEACMQNYEEFKKNQ